MPLDVPEKFQDLFRKKSFGHLATLMPDGQPQTTPVWVDFDGEHVLVNTTDDRQKFENLRSEPRVAISIQDPEDPYRYLEVRGRVADTTHRDAEAHIDALARRYLDEDRYPMREDGESRVVVKIAPEHFSSRG